MEQKEKIWDYTVIGSGFGGSVSAMRLSEKGYSVLILERGKRYTEEDYPKSNWLIWNYLWAPGLRCFGFLQLNLFKGLFAFGGGGVGGGSLVYAAVLMEPDEAFFKSEAWLPNVDWKSRLEPHFKTAKHMLGVAPNPKMTIADNALEEVVIDAGVLDGFRPTDVGVFFGEPDQAVPDPYFGGDGPERSGCNFCGGCMVGCRFNAKNTLPKNYLYFAEKMGTEVRAEKEVVDIHPIANEQPDGARFEILYRSSTTLFNKPVRVVRSRNVVVAAGVLGSVELLLNCRDVHHSMPNLSQQLGKRTRTNSEAFLGAFVPKGDVDHSKGIAISSIIRADEQTQVEPVRFSDGSSLIYWLLSTPIIESGGNFIWRLLKLIIATLKRPGEFINSKIKPGLTKRGLALMIMQTKDNLMTLKLGRNIYTLFKRRLVPQHDEEKHIPVDIELGYQVVKAFAEKINGYPVGTVPEGLLNLPTTAHMLGGCLMGETVDDGVIDEDFQAFNYPGLYIIDGSVVPANPGVNPSLTITAFVEYAMSRIPEKS